ncbi:hypothetical protein [Chitinophaga sp. Ak27]|uniref:hypothetical protein n=1 Tax=Chitinophaga sp. Ak27 TaxID=2726116 RepID=UPI00145F1BEF|nr:hypothetical protein [Chitinophaga sp. Ak27]NLU93230.1 hypothetical protein [Chitinophaga sp. Ak27]
MENLLTILDQITACGTSDGFIEVCEYELSNVIGSNIADHWTGGQRADFIMFYALFRTNIIAAFSIRDALRRDGVKDLTPSLVKELEGDLYKLSSFQSGIELHDLEAALDRYISILIDGDAGVDGTIAAITGNYFKNFFLTLHGLDIEERIDEVKSNSTNLSNFIYEY